MRPRRLAGVTAPRRTLAQQRRAAQPDARDVSTGAPTVRRERLEAVRGQLAEVGAQQRRPSRRPSACGSPARARARCCGRPLTYQATCLRISRAALLGADRRRPSWRDAARPASSRSGAVGSGSASPRSCQRAQAAEHPRIAERGAPEHDAVAAGASRACARRPPAVRTSPLPITGMPTARLASPIMSQCASPSNFSARVRA